ncbi:MAG TPA: cupin domain-containing protein [Terracidiphilus sp.]|nr:cupin domain-containing protein [Terracidiphilus sp.]
MRKTAFHVLAFACISIAAAAQSGDSNPLAAARVFPYDAMLARTGQNGSVGRRVFAGTLATGEAVSVHETLQPAGTKPNPPHRIQHSEIIVVQRGTLAFEHDGKTERASAGSVIYVTPGTLHTVENVGDGPAQYVVVQIGGDTGK